jgi:hypothetical protein
MPEFMMGFRKLRSFQRVSSLLAVAGILALAPAFADEKDEKSNNKGAAVKLPNHEQVAIPQCLEKLKLSGQQEEQVKGIIRSYDESLSMVWKQFGDRYMQTIDLESQLLAAIEDNLTEPQRQQVRNARLKTAKHEKAIESTIAKPNQATAKPANAVDDELAGVGVTLTTEQEAAAEKVEEKYRSQLRSMNRDIEGMHARLLSLSASKMVEIEKVLTKEQLKELRAQRQSAPEVKLVSNRN